MRLPKFLSTMLLLTTVALVYIHLQVQIVDFAYKGKNKQMQLQKLKDENDSVTYNICILKSANHLGLKLLADNSNLRFLDDGKIIKVVSKDIDKGEYFASLKEETRKPSLLARIFSLKSQAEAGSIK